MGRHDFELCPGWAIPQKPMDVCKHLCARTNHNNVDFLLIKLFLRHNILDFKYWYQCHQ